MPRRRRLISCASCALTARGRRHFTTIGNFRICATRYIFSRSSRSRGPRAGGWRVSPSGSLQYFCFPYTIESWIMSQSEQSSSSSTPNLEVLMGNDVQTTPFMAKRIASIDALRGFDMFWIAGAEEIIHAMYKVWPNATTAALDAQFEHVPWIGFHFYDLIFALFVFMVGVVLPFSLTRRMEEGANRGQLFRHAFQRFILLFLFGLIYNGLLDFNIHTLRILGVLQRIAICYLVAALVMMNTNIRGQAIVAGSILVVYWAIMKLVLVRSEEHTSELQSPMY